MFTKDEWMALTRKLLVLTSADKLIWTEEDDGYLDAPVGNVLYAVGSSDGDGQEPFYLAVYDTSEGKSDEIDRLESYEPDRSDDLTHQMLAQLLIPARANIGPLRNAIVRQLKGGAALAKGLLAELDELDAEDDDEGM